MQKTYVREQSERGKKEATKLLARLNLKYADQIAAKKDKKQQGA